MEHFDFDRGGQEIEVMQEEAVKLEVEFPVEQQHRFTLNGR